MSMKESKARLKASGIPTDFFWWPAKDLERFFTRVRVIGFESGRIEAASGLREDGNPELWLRVVDTVTKQPVIDEWTDGEGWEDFSHNCPPDCPNGD